MLFRTLRIADFDCRQANRNLPDFLTIGQAVFDMEADGVFSVLDGFLVGVALAVAALQGRETE
jgi:hypothetical protein